MKITAYFDVLAHFWKNGVFFAISGVRIKLAYYNNSRQTDLQTERVDKVKYAWFK